MEPASIPVAPVVTSIFTAKVNGAQWSCAPNQNSISYFMSKYGSMHEFGGTSSVDPPWTDVALHFLCQPGTYTLGSSSSHYFAYFGTSSGTLHVSRTGTINITLIDTVPDQGQQFVNKLKCTFSFVTDTIGGQSFNITEGNVDFTKP